MATRATKASLPALGQRISASGYMVRYRSPEDFERNYGYRGYAFGWKRRRVPVAGILCGIRRLRLGWSEQTYDGSDEYMHDRVVARVRVYAVAVSHQCIRYVLPRDASCVAGGD